MKRKDMVLFGAATLFDTEKSIDLAIHQTSNLIGELVRMRMEGKFSAVLGQEVFDGCSEAMTKLTEARKAMVATHGRLDEVKSIIGCRTVAIGTDTPKTFRQIEEVEQDEAQLEVN